MHSAIDEDEIIEKYRAQLSIYSYALSFELGIPADEIGLFIIAIPLHGDPSIIPIPYHDPTMLLELARTVHTLTSPPPKCADNSCRFCNNDI